MLPIHHIQQLAQRLLDEHLTLFVGAGLSRLAPRRDRGSQRLPLWNELTQLVADRCNEDPASYHHNPLDLFDAIVYGQERTTLERAVREALDDRPFDPSEAHRALVSLPWSAILTTNYDGLLARLLDEGPVANENDYDRLAGTKPRLFQIHGNLEAPHTLTREDYRLWEENHPRAYRHLESVLLTGTVLFVGYSLSDPHLDSLLAKVRKITHGREKRIYAWMWKANEAQIKLFDRRDKIEVVSIEEESGWAQAFEQLAESLRIISEAAGGSLPAITGSFAYERVQYVQALEARYGSANLQGLYIWAADYARGDVALEEIYSEPDLVCSQGDKPLDDVNELAASKIRREEKAGAPFEHRERASRVLGRERRLFIVAAPGQGKSTLLRHKLLIAARRWREQPWAEPFPIYIRLCDWEARAEIGVPSLLGYALAALPQLGEIGSNAVRAWSSGSILWLLDGVDEVRDRFERERLREEVMATAANRPQDRWVVASRPTGEPASGFAAGWQRAEMTPLSESGVRQIISRWARVLKRKEGSHLDLGELLSSLERDRGLQRLRGNALLLTLSVLFYKARHRLPHDRWEFYEVAEQVLRDSWVHHRLRHATDYLPGTYLPELLERLALLGMVSGRVLFSAAELEKECHSLLSARGYESATRDREAYLFLRASEDLIGILVAQGPGFFGFVHLTFQEFLAARALLHKSSQVPELIGRFWDHPDWQEIWSLYTLAIQSDPTRQAQLFREILAHQHPLDSRLQRHRLACLRLCGIASTPIPEEGYEIACWAAQVLQDGSEILSDQILQTLEGWIRTTVPECLRSALLQLIVKSPLMRANAIAALSPMIADAEIQRILLAQLDDKDSEVRGTAISVLSGAPALTEIRRKLLHRLEDRHPTVRQEAAAALSLSLGDESVRQSFLSLLKNPHGKDRSLAVQALEGAVMVDEVLRKELATWLDESEVYVRKTAAAVLSAAAGEPEVRQKLLVLLHDGDSSVRAAAAAALSSEAEEEEVWRELLSCLGDAHASVRRAATYSLTSVTGEEEIRQALVLRLRDRQKDVAAAAVTALSPMIANPIIRPAIFNLLGDRRAPVRAAAIQALSSLAGEDVKLLQAIIALLNDSDLLVSTSAIHALSALTTKEISEALIACLSSNVCVIRYRAAEALAAVANTEPTRRQLLKHLDDEDCMMRCAVAGSLAITANDNDVQAALIRRLKDEEASVRFAAADALRAVAGDETVREALLVRLDDNDWDVRTVVYEIISESLALEHQQLSTGGVQR